MKVADHRQWHQKLRYWVIGAFVLAALIEWKFPGVLDRFTSSGCQDISHVTGRCW